MSAVSQPEEIAALRDQMEADGQRLVFTNGCFDLLHVGHVRYLAQARALGDKLVVALNGDDSVRALKGEGRPVHPAEDRAEVLLGLESVDAVVVFESERATQCLEVIRPHLYAKGGDYTVDSLHPEERGAMEAAGTAIVILELVEGRSTSATLKKVNANRSADRRPRIAVLGSGKGSNFTAILSAREEGQLDADIPLLLSDQKDAPILQIGRDAGVTTAFVDPGPSSSGLSPAALKEIRDRLQAADVDLVVLAGFMRILKDPILSEFKGRLINIHPSLLPKYKGLHAWKQAIEAGEKVSGCTVHQVVADIDSGEILAQAEVPVLPDDSPESLHARIQEEEHRIFPETIQGLLQAQKRGD